MRPGIRVSVPSGNETMRSPDGDTSSTVTGVFDTTLHVGSAHEQGADRRRNGPPSPSRCQLLLQRSGTRIATDDSY